MLIADSPSTEMKKLRVMCVAYPLRSARTATEKQVLSTYSNAFRRERRQSTVAAIAGM